MYADRCLAMFQRNISKHVPECMVSHPTRQQSSCSLSWESQIPAHNLPIFFNLTKESAKWLVPNASVGQQTNHRRGVLETFAAWIEALCWKKFGGVAWTLGLNDSLVLCISGLVFTSPRAVRAVACIKDARRLLGGWKKHPVFVVGEGTSKIVKKELCLDGEGSNAGNSSALAEIILQSEL